MLQQVYSPSDLHSIPPESDFHLGGRLLLCVGARIVLGDALATVELNFADSKLNDSQLGVFVVLRVLKNAAGELKVIAVLSAQAQHHRLASNQTTSCGEFSRITQRGLNLRCRAEAKFAMTEYLRREAFVEVETPSLVPCPGLDPNVESLGAIEAGARGKLHLITSPEFHLKRLLVGGLPRIYQFARCYRAEEKGSHHEPEFTMLEWYRAFAGWEQTMQDTEELIRVAARAIASHELQALFMPPFERLTVREAFAEFTQVKDAVELSLHDEARYFQLLVDYVEPGLAKRNSPVFLTEYPANQAALARRCAHDCSVAERYELYFRGVELCNGYGELTDPQEQRLRFEEEIDRRKREGGQLYPLDEKFLAALQEGMPPSSGNALGFDRLVMLLTETNSLSEVFAFTDDER